jgi:hypothetical protein
MRQAISRRESAGPHSGADEQDRWGGLPREPKPGLVKAVPAPTVGEPNDEERAALWVVSSGWFSAGLTSNALGWNTESVLDGERSVGQNSTSATETAPIRGRVICAEVRP